MVVIAVQLIYLPGILLLQRLAPPSPAGGHGNTIRGGTGEAAGILKPTQST